jgi:uncharacterized protein (DUF2235 family)
MKRLALFLDGTWNDPDSNTNVFRLHGWVDKRDSAGVEQRAHYLKGVGTNWYDRLHGGALGAGLSTNVLAGYGWLSENYDDGDEIYLFGFSRGAYTARSVAGVIVRCGLLQSGATMSVGEVYERYRAGKDLPPIYGLLYARDFNKRALTASEQRLLDNCRRVPIHMIGVWDTVGALGVPWTNAPLLGRKNFYFHNTNLSKLFVHAYQALAIDEWRGPYKPTLWTDFIPDDAPAVASDRTQAVEQRWFIGAHCNVGGGYADDRLCDVPLAWLQRKAMDCGLSFGTQVPLRGDEHKVEPVDSYAQFLHGIYKWLRLGKRYYRPIGAGPRKVKGGLSVPINETIDESVFRRWRNVDRYRPANLANWAKARGLDVGGLEVSGGAQA